VALQVLYAIDLATRHRREDDVPTPGSPDADAGVALAADESRPCAVFDGVAEHFEMPVGARAFAKELAVAVSEHRDELDELISAHTKNWRIVRMAAVDRNILRLGTYELVHTETPSAVILNEAIDLASRYGSDPSAAFVNGILDAIANHVREVPS
jgi:transcription antitermination factor NusB